MVYFEAGRQRRTMLIFNNLLPYSASGNWEEVCFVLCLIIELLVKDISLILKDYVSYLKR